ncbi:hypothetical protein TNCV_46661 [Trichonephila clavipes]|nr:hypothetical protein TNCV_46661 [Trichonephila clavipes]
MSLIIIFYKSRRKVCTDNYGLINIIYSNISKLTRIRSYSVFKSRRLAPEPDEIDNVIEEVVNFSRQISLGHQSLPPTNLGRVDKEMASPSLRLSQSKTLKNLDL